MRFGSHTHEKSDQVDAPFQSERSRLVTALRRLADRVEAAPMDRAGARVALVATAVETAVRAVDRALGQEKSTPSRPSAS